MSNRSPNSVKGSSRKPVYRHTRLRYIWRSHTQRPPTVRLGHTTNICVQGRSTWTMVPLGNGGKRGIGGNSWPMSCPFQQEQCVVFFIWENNNESVMNSASTVVTSQPIPDTHVGAVTRLLICPIPLGDFRKLRHYVYSHDHLNEKNTASCSSRNSNCIQYRVA